jgi:hypothetical protein
VLQGKEGKGDICCTQQPLGSGHTQQKPTKGTTQAPGAHSQQTPQPLKRDCGGSAQALGCGQIQTNTVRTTYLHRKLQRSSSSIVRYKEKKKKKKKQLHRAHATTSQRTAGYRKVATD